jgi:hypothetical protein
MSEGIKFSSPIPDEQTRYRSYKEPRMLSFCLMINQNSLQNCCLYVVEQEQLMVSTTGLSKFRHRTSGIGLAKPKLSPVTGFQSFLTKSGFFF